MVDIEAQRFHSPVLKHQRAILLQGRQLSRRWISILSVVALVGLLWAVKIHTLMWYRINCEDLSHRDQRFVHKSNAYMCLSDVEVSTVLRDLTITAADVFQAHNVTYFLESGTLLGSFREKGVIRHDDDVDLGIDAAGLEYLRNNRVQFPEGYTIDVWNSSVYPGSTRDDKLPVRITHKQTALYADVFAFLDWKDELATGAHDDAVGPLPSVCFKRCAACPFVGEYRHFTVPRQWVYPLVDCPFEGRLLKCPREATKYLEHMYGKNYMIPT